MSTTFRQMIEGDTFVRAPGVWNGLSARLAEDAGFPLVFGSGLAIAAAMGLPDSDIYTKSDVLHAMAQVRSATKLPVVADGDTGFGTAVNAAHLVRDLELIGVQGVALEDQQSPKRCPLLPGAELPLVSIEEGAGKIRAAVEARRSSDFVIIARCDATSPEEMHRRADAYAEAGADMFFPNPIRREAFPVEDWAKVHQRTGLPLVACPIPGGWLEQEMTPEVMQEVGVRLEWLSIYPLYEEMAALQAAMKRLVSEPRFANISQTSFQYKDLIEVVRYDEVSRLQHEFIPQG